MKKHNVFNWSLNATVKASQNGVLDVEKDECQGKSKNLYMKRAAYTQEARAHINGTTAITITTTTTTTATTPTI